jgi:hypothetical protein
VAGILLQHVTIAAFSLGFFRFLDTRAAQSPGFPTLGLLRRIAGRKAFLRRFVDSLVVASRPMWISLLLRLAGPAVGVATIPRRLFSLDVAITTAPISGTIAFVGFIHESFHLAITPL